jgi:hypothetical protein
MIILLATAKNIFGNILAVKNGAFYYIIRSNLYVYYAMSGVQLSFGGVGKFTILESV